MRFLSIFLGCAAIAGAQWLHEPTKGIPRTREGKPDLKASVRRQGGRPDLSGIWQVDSTPRSVLGNYLFPDGSNGLGEDDVNVNFVNYFHPTKFGEEPFTPGGAAQFRQMMQAGGKPPTLCPPPAIPIQDMAPAPFKIVQSPGLTLFLYESDTAFRQIFTDGRRLPEDPNPSWMGNSVGHWENDTLVIETNGLNPAPLDAMGHFHSGDARVTEKFRRIDVGHMELEIITNDPKVYTKPVSIKVGMRLLPDTELIEGFCESDHDLTHMGH